MLLEMPFGSLWASKQVAKQIDLGVLARKLPHQHSGQGTPLGHGGIYVGISLSGEQDALRKTSCQPAVQSHGPAFRSRGDKDLGAPEVRHMPRNES